MHKILVVNGPNINMLGIRELDKYGKTSYQELKDIIQDYSIDKFHLETYQSNVEGEIVSKLHKVIEEGIDGLIINPGAYTHTSIAIRDALAILKIPSIEVHISNIYAREKYRQHSLLSKNCVAVIAGLGLQGYAVAVDYFLKNQQSLAKHYWHNQH